MTKKPEKKPRTSKKGPKGPPNLAAAAEPSDEQPAKPPKANRRRQQEIPGTEPPRIKEIDDAALTYAEHRDARIAAGVDEKRAKKTLLSLMQGRELKRYPFTDPSGARLVVEFDIEEKLKVKKLDVDDDEQDDDED